VVKGGEQRGVLIVIGGEFTAGGAAPATGKRLSWFGRGGPGYRTGMG